MTSHHEGLEVVEAGRALRVHTDMPHLVSLGGGRLSTAVTLHPLPQGERDYRTLTAMSEFWSNDTVIAPKLC
jgi:hypothetical protein